MENDIFILIALAVGVLSIGVACLWIWLHIS